MAHCKRCNKFMVFNSQTGYCNNCYKAVLLEEKRSREEIERQRKAEEERKRKEEARKAEEERERKEEEARKAEEEHKRKEEQSKCKPYEECQFGEKPYNAFSLLRGDGIYFFERSLGSSESPYSFLRFFPNEKKVVSVFSSTKSVFALSTKEFWRKNDYAFDGKIITFTSQGEHDNAIKDEFYGELDEKSILIRDKRTYYDGSVKEYNNVRYDFMSDEELFSEYHVQEKENPHQQSKNDVSSQTSTLNTLSDDEKLSALKSKFLEQYRNLVKAIPNMAIALSISDVHGIDTATYRSLVSKATDLKREEKYIEASETWFSILLQTNCLISSVVDSWGKTLIVAGDIIDAIILANIQGVIHKEYVFYPETIAERINELRYLANDQSSFMMRLKEYSGNDTYNLHACNIDVLSNSSVKYGFVNDTQDFINTYLLPRITV